MTSLIHLVVLKPLAYLAHERQVHAIGQGQVELGFLKKGQTGHELMKLVRAVGIPRKRAGHYECGDTIAHAVMTFEDEKRLVLIEVLNNENLILQSVERISDRLLFLKKLYNIVIACYCFVLEYFERALDSFLKFFTKHLFEVVFGKEFDKFRSASLKICYLLNQELTELVHVCHF